jgi:hypothetical protein
VGEREPLPAPDVDAVERYLAVFFLNSSDEISFTSEVVRVTSDPDLASLKRMFCLLGFRASNV